MAGDPVGTPLVPPSVAPTGPSRGAPLRQATCTPSPPPRVLPSPILAPLIHRSYRAHEEPVLLVNFLVAARVENRVATAISPPVGRVLTQPAHGKEVRTSVFRGRGDVE